jgi:hypothetical protein
MNTKTIMTNQKVFGFALVLAALASVSARAEVKYSDLSDAEKTAVNGGQQVVKKENVANSAWPRVTVFQRIEATPDQVAAVMFDYAAHKEFFEGITLSTPKTPGAATTDIDYIMTLPKVMGISLPDENYTVTDVLTKVGADGYAISWKMVKASSMQDTNGVAKFEKLGTATLVSYTNFINPPTKYGSLAGLISGMAADRVKGSVTSLDKQVQKERSSDQARLTAQLAALSKALGR